MPVAERADAVLAACARGSKDGLEGLDEGRIELKGAGRVSLDGSALELVGLLEATEGLGEEESGVDGLWVTTLALQSRARELGHTVYVCLRLTMGAQWKMVGGMCESVHHTRSYIFLA